MNKPKMELFVTNDNYYLIQKASKILESHGMKKEAKEIHQRASIRGYNIHVVLKLLKKYMNI